MGRVVIAVITSGVGALLIYMAIGEKNATLASLIEISYPLFVAFFAWVFFRETQFNAGTSGVTENWTGLFTAKINPPKNEAELRANPLGIFITAFQWSREL